MRITANQTGREVAGSSERRKLRLGLGAVALALLVAALPSRAFAQPSDDIEIDTPGDDIEVDTTEQPTDDSGTDAPIDLPDAKTSALSERTPKTKVAWSDIVVVPRKAFLKRKRYEFLPMFGSTLNDNMINHVGFGGQIHWYVSETAAVGIEGQLLNDSFREPFDLVARQARRLPTVNRYNWSGALNFQYVPVYGKFALFNRKILTWEAYFTLGGGITQTEVIPRDTRYGAFTNHRLTFNAGAALRFFLTKFLTVNVGVRDYVFSDKFEPTNRSDTQFASPEEAKDNADSALINNVMFQVGIGFWLKPTFEYTTFR